MPRGTTPQKRVAQRASSKYDYTELSKASLTNDTPCNFYGVIVDATFPYQVNAEKMFVCSLKVVDPSLNNKGDFAQVVLYANKFEDLPIVHRLGDVIRVHRANVKKDNRDGVHRQFTANIYYSSSWALYSADKTTPLGQNATEGPYAFSGKRSTHEKQDSAIQQTLKKWAHNSYFNKHNVGEGGRTAALNNCHKQSGDFDVNAKVLQVFELDEYTNELKLRDASGATFHTLALKLKFPHIKSGSVVRIRSATYDTTSSKKNVLILQHYSNIMTHISSSKLAAALSKVNNDNSSEKAALKSGVSMTPVVLTEVDKKHANLATSTLHDLFHSPDNSTNTFRVCFYVTRTEPGHVEEACKVYNKSSKKTTSAKGSKGGDLIYQVQFLAKDVSTQFSNNVYKILLYTHEGLGQNFFAQKAANLHSDAKAAGKVGDAFNLLGRFNSWVDAVVERRNGFYFIKDTRMIY